MLSKHMTRREFLQFTAIGVAAAMTGCATSGPTAASYDAEFYPPSDLKRSWEFSF